MREDERYVVKAIIIIVLIVAGFAWSVQDVKPQPHDEPFHIWGR